MRTLPDTPEEAQEANNCYASEILELGKGNIKPYTLLPEENKKKYSR